MPATPPAATDAMDSEDNFHNDWRKNVQGTAKCDWCSDRNKKGVMQYCNTCHQNICWSCVNSGRLEDDDHHVLREDVDHYFNWIRPKTKREIAIAQKGGKRGGRARASSKAATRSTTSGTKATPKSTKKAIDGRKGTEAEEPSQTLSAQTPAPAPSLAVCVKEQSDPNPQVSFPQPSMTPQVPWHQQLPLRGFTSPSPSPSASASASASPFVSGMSALQYGPHYPPYTGGSIYPGHTHSGFGVIGQQPYESYSQYGQTTFQSAHARSANQLNQENQAYQPGNTSKGQWAASQRTPAAPPPSPAASQHAIMWPLPAPIAQMEDAPMSIDFSAYTVGQPGQSPWPYAQNRLPPIQSLDLPRKRAREESEPRETISSSQKERSVKLSRMEDGSSTGRQALKYQSGQTKQHSPTQAKQHSPAQTLNDQPSENVARSSTNVQSVQEAGQVDLDKKSSAVSRAEGSSSSNNLSDSRSSGALPEIVVIPAEDDSTRLEGSQDLLELSRSAWKQWMANQKPKEPAQDLTDGDTQSLNDLTTLVTGLATADNASIPMSEGSASFRLPPLRTKKALLQTDR